jgi:serine/threonine-protein kinase
VLAKPHVSCDMTRTGVEAFSPGLTVAVTESGQTSIRRTLRERVVRAASPHVRNRRLITGVSAIISGCVITTLLFLMLLRQHQAAHRDAFVVHTAAITEELRRAFESPVEILRSVRAFFGASDSVTGAEFHAFVEDALARFPAISLLEWAPYVPGELRDSFVAAARSESPGFEITESLRAGEFTPAARRAEYVPLRFIEPRDDLAALGFDLMSEASRRARVRRAADGGEPIASDRFRLMEDSDGMWSIAVYFAVYRNELVPPTADQRWAELEGITIAIFRLQPIISSVFNEFENMPVGVRLTDVTNSGNEQTLFEHRWSAVRWKDDDDLLRRVPWNYAGRSWELDFQNTQPVRIPWPAWTILLAGIAISVLFGSFVIRTGEVSQLKREVAEARRLGQYTLIRRLGKGGMGIVYAARHAFLRRPTAIKVLQKGTDELSIARFEREVQMTALLTHPNTVAIFDFGRTDAGEFYYAMELLEGFSFEQLVQQFGPIKPARAIFLIRQALDALGEAHIAGLIHRDIKPGNLMTTQRGTLSDFVKVLDFGLVKEVSASEDTSLTQTKVILGTPQYLAPETIDPEATVDTRADLYAMGAVLYFLLTGEPVFTARTVVGLCFQHLTEKPVPPSDRSVFPIPRDLEAVVMRSLEKKPQNRFQTAADFRLALDACAASNAWTRELADAWWVEHRQATLIDIEAPNPTLTPLTINISDALHSDVSSKTPSHR